jgi:hypothetical protein
MNASKFAVASLVLVLGASSLSAQSSAAKDSSRKPTGGRPPASATAILKCGNDSLVQCRPTPAAKATGATAGTGGPKLPGLNAILKCGNDSLVQRTNANCSANATTKTGAKAEARKDTAAKRP